MNRTSPPAEEPHLATPAPVQPTPAPPTVAKPAEPASARPERRLAGIAVSPGVAIGPVFGAIEPPAIVVRTRIHASDSGAETSRLEAAIAQSRKQLLKLRARLGVLPEDSQAEIAPLLDAYLQMVGPSRLVRGAKKRIAEGLVSAETAVFDESEAIAELIQIGSNSGSIRNSVTDRCISEPGADAAERAIPERRDLNRLAATRCHDPVVELRIHPGELATLCRSHDEPIAISADAKVGAVAVGGDDAQQRWQ